MALHCASEFFAMNAELEDINHGQPLLYYEELLELQQRSRKRSNAPRQVAPGIELCDDEDFWPVVIDHSGVARNTHT